MKVLLETERLRLANWGPEAVDELFDMHDDPEVARYLDARGKGWTREHAAGRLAGWQREHERFGLGKFRVTRKSDGTFVGRAGFSPYGQDEPEIGYCFARSYWGQGYASEMAAALRDWFFATRADDHFIGFAHIDNAASRKVLERIGMVPTHLGMVAEMPHQFYVLDRPVT